MSRTVLAYESVPVQPPAVTNRYALLGLLCAAAVIAYVQRSGIAVAAGAIQAELGLDKVGFGTVMSAWSLGYAVGQIPSGWLADRWGSRRALTLYAATWSLVTGLIAISVDYYSLLALWTLMGLAQAGIFPCCTRAIRRAFTPERRASANGLLACFMGIGGALAPMLTGLLLVAIAWRWVFILYAVPGLAWAALFYRWLRDAPLDHAAQPAGLAGHNDAGPRDVPAWRRMLTSGSMWLLCSQQFLRGAAMSFFATWFPTFLRETRGVTVMQSGLLTALAGVGLVIGPLLGGLASDRVLSATGNARLSRQGIAVAGMVACSLLILCAYFISDTTMAVGMIGVAAFCGAFGGVSGYTVSMDFGGARVATVFSVVNTCGNLGAAVFPLAIGWLVDRSGNWNMVLFIFSGIFAVDAILWALLNPKRPLFEEA